MLPLLLLTAPAVCAAPPAMPAWWEHWKTSPSFKSAFVQKGDSAAFGSITRTGAIRTASGGRLRVEYQKGVSIVSDGATLVQYDPSTRTAQKFDLATASEEWPLLRILTDPSALAQVFLISPKDDGRVLLTPKNRNTELPEILLAGSGGYLRSAEWIDGTGARQTLTLTSPGPATDKGTTFTFDPPKGTRWLH